MEQKIKQIKEAREFLSTNKTDKDEVTNIHELEQDEKYYIEVHIKDYYDGTYILEKVIHLRSIYVFTKTYIPLTDKLKREHKTHLVISKQTCGFMLLNTRNWDNLGNWCKIYKLPTETEYVLK
jgi:hypothetical protein